eukprot:6473838-Amphidinium_carterae.1
MPEVLYGFANNPLWQIMPRDIANACGAGCKKNRTIDWQLKEPLVGTCRVTVKFHTNNNEVPVPPYAVAWLKSSFALYPVVVNRLGEEEPIAGPIRPGTNTMWKFETVQALARARQINNPEYWAIPSPIALLVVILHPAVIATESSANAIAPCVAPPVQCWSRAQSKVGRSQTHVSVGVTNCNAAQRLLMTCGATIGSVLALFP